MLKKLITPYFKKAISHIVSSTYKVTLLSLVLISSAAAKGANVTGMYAGLCLGGVYLYSFKEFIRHSSQNSGNQVELFNVNKGLSLTAGLHIGFGFESKGGFYIGAHAHGYYDLTKITGQDTNAKGQNRKNLILDHKKHIVTVDHEIDQGRPTFSFGGAVFLGVKMNLNTLIFIGVGCEKTQIKSKQAIVARDIAIINDFGSEKTFKTKDSQGNDITLTLLDLPGAELKTNIVSFFPCIGGKLFLTPNIYVGAQLDLLIGKDKEIEEKYFDENFEVTVFKKEGEEEHEEKVKMKSLKDYDSKLFINRKFTLRGSLSIGYKF